MAIPQLKALLEVRPLVGTFLKLPQPEIVEVLALAGLDFLICDTEHAQIDERGVGLVLSAARAVDIPVVVRTASLDPAQINRFLEAGAAGIQLSSTSSCRQGRMLQAAVRYPPTGRRSLSTAQPAARFGTTPLAEYLAESNAGITAIGQIETANYDDPLEDIMDVLDLAFVGTMDLSLDLGRPGETDAPQVRAKLAEIELAASRTGTPLGTFAVDVDGARRAFAAGYRYVAVASDLAMLSASVRQQFAGLSAKGA
jgi:4-hydroxy-2-oxoheptanedioate aldolase